MQKSSTSMISLSLKEKRKLCIESLASLFFPRRCPFCNRVIGYLPECDTPGCNTASNAEKRKPKTLDPSEYYLGALTGAAAVYNHRAAPRAAILRLKFSQAKPLGRIMGNLMAKELFGCEFSNVYGVAVPNSLPFRAGYHLIVPVPPSDGSRGYNVPSLFAQSLHHALGAPVAETALRRARFTKRQVQLSPAERFANVAGAFAASEGLDLTGKDVLLVDDVITTGATVTACAQALYQAGANSVFAVSFTAGLKEGQHRVSEQTKK